jgi:hypothetical protein
MNTMPLLAYCIVETAAVIEVLRTGVNSIPIESVEHGDLRCFVSQTPDTAVVPGGQIREAALTFHQVLDEVFRQAAIIPFRFPTILSGEAGVTAHLAKHSLEYRTALSRLRHMVQMEIRLQFKTSPPTPELAGTGGETPAKLSGIEYLQKIQARHAKLEIAAKGFRQVCGRLTLAWKQRDSVEGVRCFALIERTAIEEFQKTLTGANIESELVARLSGPWPATQFLKEE